MTKVTKRARRTDNAPPTARERHRPRWVPVLSSGIVLAVALHAGLFAFAPLIGIDHPFGYRLHSAPMQLVELSPAKAESLDRTPIARPPLPTVEQLAVHPEVFTSVALPTFEHFAVEDAAIEVPPMPSAEEVWLEYRDFAAFVIRPQVINRDETTRYLQRIYQPVFEFSGVTGVVQVTFWINERGEVEKAEVLKSSGSRILDRLALRLSRIMEFRPATMAGRPVRILVSMPITFRAA